MSLGLIFDSSVTLLAGLLFMARSSYYGYNDIATCGFRKLNCCGTSGGGGAAAAGDGRTRRRRRRKTKRGLITNSINTEPGILAAIRTR